MREQDVQQFRMSLNSCGTAQDHNEASDFVHACQYAVTRVFLYARHLENGAFFFHRMVSWGWFG